MVNTWVQMKECHFKKEKYNNDFFEYSLETKKRTKGFAKKHRKDCRLKFRKKGGGKVLYALNQLKGENDQ